MEVDAAKSSETPESEKKAKPLGWKFSLVQFLTQWQLTKVPKGPAAGISNIALAGWIHERR